MSDATQGLSPLQQIRPLTAERKQYFSRTAETLAERFELELGRWLSEVTVRVEMIEQMIITDLAGDQCDLAVVKSEEFLNQGLVVTDLSLALALVAGLCGGDPAQDVEVRPLTRLETGVYDLIAGPVLAAAGQLFQTGELTAGVHVNQVAALPDSKPEFGIGIRFAIRVGTVEGKVAIGLPLSHLQDYSESVDRKIAGRVATTNRVNPAAVKVMHPVVVDLVVGFDPVKVPTAQLADLQVGDVLRTGQSVSKSLVARVGKEGIFNVRAAQRGQRLVAEFVSRIDDGFRDGIGKSR